MQLGRRKQRIRNIISAQKQDYIYRVLSKNQEVAVLVVDATSLVLQAQKLHQTAPTATAALGRALIGGLLLNVFRKDEEQLQITFEGQGSIGTIQIIANTQGQVKGRVGNPRADPPLKANGKLNVGAAVGPGILKVFRTHPSEPEPYTGIIPLYNGEIAEDLTHYLLQSEQTSSAVALGVQLGKNLQVINAGGYFVQILPNASEQSIDSLEKNITQMQTISELLANGQKQQDIANIILQGIDNVAYVQNVQSEIQPGILGCEYGPCEEDQIISRMKRTLITLGREDIEKILQKEGKIEVTDEFCKLQYTFSQQDLDDVFNAFK